MSKWKYFTDEESVGQTDEFCRMRDDFREWYGYPIVQTCGIRSQEQAILDGCPHSAHVTGQAGDFRAPADLFMRERMAWAAGKAGFVRVESCPRHFHLDCDLSKPNPAFFQGPDK